MWVLVADEVAVCVFAVCVEVAESERLAVSERVRVPTEDVDCVIEAVCEKDTVRLAELPGVTVRVSVPLGEADCEMEAAEVALNETVKLELEHRVAVLLSEPETDDERHRVGETLSEPDMEVVRKAVAVALEKLDTDGVKLVVVEEDDVKQRDGVLDFKGLSEPLGVTVRVNVPAGETLGEPDMEEVRKAVAVALEIPDTDGVRLVVVEEDDVKHWDGVSDVNELEEPPGVRVRVKVPAGDADGEADITEVPEGIVVPVNDKLKDEILFVDAVATIEDVEELKAVQVRVSVPKEEEEREME